MRSLPPVVRIVSVGVVLASAALFGCATPRVVGMPKIPEAQLPSNLQPQSKCQIAASQGSPLVTEWPATEKANLEILARRGAVAVAFSGCSMRVLSNCSLRGTYVWNRTSPTSDYIEINDEDELFAKLPLGAVGLEAELKRWGKLTVQTAVSGQLRLEGIQPNDLPMDGECAQATHVVGALAVGAFTMSTGGGNSVGAGVNATLVGAGGKVGRSGNVVRAAGMADSCGDGTEQAPHPNCRSPIQVFLWPIPARSGQPGVMAPPAGTLSAPPMVSNPGGMAPTPPPSPLTAPGPGRIPVEVISAEANSRWDIYVDDEVTCSTPCTRYLDPTHPIYLRARPNGLPGVPPDELSIRDLFPAAETGAVQLQARPTSRGQMVTGITFTSLGGMAVFTGGFLALAGCSSDSRPGLCTGGAITAGVGAVVTAGAVWLMLDSLPKAAVVPLQRVAEDGSRGPTVVVGPGAVAGTF